jgi:Holliday junction resolvasome RuvABC endonuclease subunit
MRILSLDISTCTGVAVVDTDGTLVTTGEIQTKDLRDMPRCAFLARKTVALLELWKPGLVVLEGYAFSKNNTVQLELGTVIRYFLWQMEMPMIEVAPTQLKQFVTGSGAGKKEHMMMNVLKVWGHESATNNIADAIGLAYYGSALVGGEVGNISQLRAKPLAVTRKTWADTLSKFSKESRL